jgi:hypothetical protein
VNCRGSGQLVWSREALQVSFAIPSITYPRLPQILQAEGCNYLTSARQKDEKHVSEYGIQPFRGYGSGHLGATDNTKDFLCRVSNIPTYCMIAKNGECYVPTKG